MTTGKPKSSVMGWPGAVAFSVFWGGVCFIFWTFMTNCSAL